MALNIIKGSDPIEVAHPVFMIFGTPGICKTSLGYSFEAPLLLDFDEGAHRAANRQDTLPIPTWDTAIALTSSRDALTDYHTIVVDTVGRCLDKMVAHLAQSDPKNFPGGNPTLQGYGKLKAQFRNWVATLRGMGKDVVLLAHDKEDKDGDRRLVRPDIMGGSYGEVLKIADFVGYVQMNGKARVLDFNPTDAWIGKNPARWEPILIPPVEQATRLGADLMTKGREALGRISAESASIAGQVEALRKEFEAYTTAGECTSAIAQLSVANLPAAVKAPAWTLLQARAAALGCTYDKAGKVFVAPVAPADAGAAEKPKRRRASPLHDEGETAPNGFGEGA